MTERYLYRLKACSSTLRSTKSTPSSSIDLRRCVSRKV